MDEKKTNIFAIVGFILGLIAFWIYPVWIGVPGLICGAIGLAKSSVLHSGKGLSIAAIVLGCINVGYGIIVTLINVLGAI